MLRNERFRRSMAALWCSTLLAAAPAAAQTASGNAERQPKDDAVALLIGSLHDKGILSDAEYRTMLTRLSPHSATSASSGVTSTTHAPAAVVTAQEAGSPADGVEPAQPQATVAKGGGRVAAATPADGLRLDAGPVTAIIHASVNGFYAHVSGSPDTPQHRVDGGFATVGQSSSAIRSGFVPGYLKIELATQQRGWDVGAHFGFYPGINSVAGQPNLVGVPQAFNVGGLDVRQVYLTLSRPGFGEIKVGRDIGLFGQDAGGNDFSQLGMGTPPANPAPTNSTLGRIGVGYIYADFMPQITYSTPNLGGLKASVGVFQPLVTVGQQEVNGTPGFQGRVAYGITTGRFSATLWSSGIIQHHDATLRSGGRSYTGRGIDAGAKLGYDDFALTGYYYTGTALGIAGLFNAPLGSNLRSRDSHGFYVQPTYHVGRVLLGASYGGSWLDRAEGEPVSATVHSNTSWYGGARYSLTDWVTLSGEYVETRSTAQNGNRAVSDAVIAGAILAF